MQGVWSCVDSLLGLGCVATHPFFWKKIPCPDGDIDEFFIAQAGFLRVANLLFCACLGGRLLCAGRVLPASAVDDR
jgi:hypothetical protein